MAEDWSEIQWGSKELPFNEEDYRTVLKMVSHEDNGCDCDTCNVIRDACAAITKELFDSRVPTQKEKNRIWLGAAIYGHMYMLISERVGMPASKAGMFHSIIGNFALNTPTVFDEALN